jgi:hypothetical protein
MLCSLLSYLRSCPVVRFRQARYGSGWVLSGVPVGDRVLVGRLLYAAGCCALSSPAIHGVNRSYVAFHISCPQPVQQSLWAEFGSFSLGTAGQSLEI